jgi:hypothetical protein
VDIATQAHSKIEINIHTLSNRKKIAEIAERFHKKADTLTPRVKHSLELLANRDVVVIESAHQPSLFPYSGTLIKPVLVHVIAEALRTQGLPVVELFGLLDTDDIKTGWHRRTHLPDLNSKEGILVIKKDVTSKKLIFNAVPAPELEEITAWKDMLVNWVRQNRKAINNALDCYPSILDYWVNFGIRKTRDNCEQFIKAHDFWDEATISCLSKGKS